jgi:peptide/nickel transport system substrate-binding protein
LRAGTVPVCCEGQWRLFAAGTPLANDAEIEVLRAPRDYAAVRQALGRAGYDGEKIVVIAPTDA